MGDRGGGIWRVWGGIRGIVGKCVFELQTDGGFITCNVTWWPGNGVIVCKPIGVLTHSDDGIGTIIA